MLIIQCHAADAIIVTRERQQEQGRGGGLIPLVRVGSNDGKLH